MCAFLKNVIYLEMQHNGFPLTVIALPVTLIDLMFYKQPLYCSLYLCYIFLKG